MGVSRLSEKLVAEAKHHFKVIAQMWGSEIQHFQKFISSSELFGMFWSNDSNELFTSSWTICVVCSKKAANTFVRDKSNWQFLRCPNLRVSSEKHRRLIDTSPWRAVLIYGDSTQESRLERQCRSWIRSCMETARTSFNAGDKTDLKSLPKTASSSRIRAAGSFSSTMYFQALIWERHVAYSESESVKTYKSVRISFEAGQYEIQAHFKDPSVFDQIEWWVDQ